jgi:type I restriction enzyme, R subunit
VAPLKHRATFTGYAALPVFHDQMREAQKRGESLNLSEEEVAFYDALEVNDSAVKVLGDQTLKTIARELVETVRRNMSIDWTATLTVLEQAELLCAATASGRRYWSASWARQVQVLLERYAPWALLPH